jgi:diguanylate cyclase (GGDEF)-like protein/PAS domain S-box-containing protein
VGGAAMVAPLRVGRVLLGLVGIASADDEHEWGESERETLQQVADTLANVLARLRDAEALHASERRLGAMLANVREILLVLDREGRIRYVNESAESALGTEIADAIGQHFLSFVHPDDHQSALEAFERQMILGVPTTIELRVLHGDGSVRWLEADSSLENPVVGGIMVSLRDVSSRHQAVWLAQRHAAHEKVLLELAQWALQVEPEDVFNGLHGHLELLGRTLDADMAFTALLDGNRLRNVAGWSATAAPLDYQLPADGRQLPALVAKFSQLETLVVDDIERFEGDWADEWRSFPVVDRAGLNVPLVSGGRCLGGLGVAMRHAPRSWLPDEIALVERVAGTVAALIAREQVEHELRRSEARLAALLDGSHDVVVVVDEAGVLRYANGAVRRLLGYEPEHLVGRSVFEFIVPADRKVAVERLASLSSDRFTPLSVLRLRAADGRVVAWEITSGAVQDPMVGGRVLACRDVTARLADEAAAARWVELLRFAFDVAQSALDVDALEFIERLPDLCAGIARLLQVDMVYVDQFDEDRRVIANLGGWVTREHSCPVLHNGEVVSFSAVPRWLERLRRAEPVVVEDLSVSSEPWAREKVRVLGPVGGSLAVPMSSAGELMGVFGVAMSTSTRRFGDDEVTFMRIVAETLAHVLERSRLDAALRHSEARFRLLSETAADLVIMVGLDGVLRYVSPSSLALLGVPAHQLVGTPAEDLIHPDDREDASQDISRMLADGPTMSEMRLRRSDGSYIWVVNSTSSIVDPVTGRVNGLRASLRDISDRKRLEAELEHQALHDPLTGLGNRILLQRRLDAAVGAAEIVDHPASPRVSVLLADLDGFKFVNDTHGHAFGDEVLRIVASRLRSHCRPQDTLARTGGDEFVLLCPGTDATSAVEIAQRLVDAIRSPISVGEVSVDLGVSIGVAHREGLVADSDELLIEADRAMYAAKRDGRCRVALVDRVVT